MPSSLFVTLRRALQREAESYIIFLYIEQWSLKISFKAEINIIYKNSVCASQETRLSYKAQPVKAV
jgi:hypothetical protein